MVEIDLPDELIDLVGKDIFAPALNVAARSIAAPHRCHVNCGRHSIGFLPCTRLFHRFFFWVQCQAVSGRGVHISFATTSPIGVGLDSNNPEAYTTSFSDNSLDTWVVSCSVLRNTVGGNGRGELAENANVESQ